MENKRKRSTVDVGDDNMHIQKILKVFENPYDADDEDSSSESESCVEHILVTADYFAPKVDKFEAGRGNLLLKVAVCDTLSPNINNCENSFTDNDSQAEDHDLNECLANVPLDCYEPEIDEFQADSGYMLENLYYNSTLSPKIVSNENSSTASDLIYSELHIKERLDAVPIDNILPVTGLKLAMNTICKNCSNVICIYFDDNYDKCIYCSNFDRCTCTEEK